MNFNTFRDTQIRNGRTGEMIEKFAIIYERYKDVCTTENRCTILKPAIHELWSYIAAEYAKIENIVTFADCEIDCDLLDTLYLKTGEIWVSTLHNHSNLFPEQINLKWRAIHDKLQIDGAKCDFWGEYETWYNQGKGLSHLAKQILFSEIVLQAAFYIHYGYFKDVQKVVLVDIPELD
jgi:hypothetical protein